MFFDARQAYAVYGSCTGTKPNDDGSDRIVDNYRIGYARNERYVAALPTPDKEWMDGVLSHTHCTLPHILAPFSWLGQKKSAGPDEGPALREGR